MMHSAPHRAPAASAAPVVIRAPDPTLGVGRALRAVYTSGDSSIPGDLQKLLDRMS